MDMKSLELQRGVVSLMKESYGMKSREMIEMLGISAGVFYRSFYPAEHVVSENSLRMILANLKSQRIVSEIMLPFRQLLILRVRAAALSVMNQPGSFQSRRAKFQAALIARFASFFPDYLTADLAAVWGIQRPTFSEYWNGKLMSAMVVEKVILQMEQANLVGLEQLWVEDIVAWKDFLRCVRELEAAPAEEVKELLLRSREVFEKKVAEGKPDRLLAQRDVLEEILRRYEARYSFEEIAEQLGLNDHGFRWALTGGYLLGKTVLNRFLEKGQEMKPPLTRNIQKKIKALLVLAFASKSFRVENRLSAQERLAWQVREITQICKFYERERVSVSGIILKDLGEWFELGDNFALAMQGRHLLSAAELKKILDSQIRPVLPKDIRGRLDRLFNRLDPNQVEQKKVARLARAVSVGKIDCEELGMQKIFERRLVRPKDLSPVMEVQVSILWSLGRLYSRHTLSEVASYLGQGEQMLERGLTGEKQFSGARITRLLNCIQADVSKRFIDRVRKWRAMAR
jgi:hypothetical protein